MDFPIEFNNINTKFIDSLDELKQTIYLLLKNPVGTFLQSYSIGATFSIHDEEDIIETSIAETIRQVEDVRDVTCVFKGNSTYKVEFTYKSGKMSWDLTLNRT